MINKKPSVRRTIIIVIILIIMVLMYVNKKEENIAPGINNIPATIKV